VTALRGSRATSCARGQGCSWGCWASSSPWTTGWLAHWRMAAVGGCVGSDSVPASVRCSHGGYEEYKLTVLHYEVMSSWASIRRCVELGTH